MEGGCLVRHSRKINKAEDFLGRVRINRKPVVVVVGSLGPDRISSHQAEAVVCLGQLRASNRLPEGVCLGSPSPNKAGEEQEVVVFSDLPRISSPVAVCFRRRRRNRAVCLQESDNRINSLSSSLVDCLDHHYHSRNPREAYLVARGNNSSRSKAVVFLGPWVVHSSSPSSSSRVCLEVPR